MTDFKSVVIIKSNDEALASQEAKETVRQIAKDRSVLEFEEYSAAEEMDLDNILSNLSTPSMLGDHRFVHIKKAQTIDKAGWNKIQEFSDLNLDISTLILSTDGGSIPPSVNAKLTKTATITEIKLDNAKLKSNFIHKSLRRWNLNLEPQAVRYLEQNIADNLANLDSILGILANTYGNQSQITSNQLEQFLTVGSATQPWKLSDAINTGKTADALQELYSLIVFTKLAPMAVISTLFKNYELMLKVYDLKFTTDDQIRESVEGVHPFVVKKASASAKNIGVKGIFRAVMLLADAELQLRGTTGLDEMSVMEILIGRLSQISRGIS